VTGFARTWGKARLPPALLLHCSLAHSGAWAGVAKVLDDRLHLIAPDLVGHGRGPAHDTVCDYHDQVTEAVATHLPDAPCHLIGHSFGATVALRLTIEQPAMVAGLTLIEPVLFAAAGDGAEVRANDAALAGMNPALAAGDDNLATAVFLAEWGGGQALSDMPPAQPQYMRDRIWVVPASAPALSDDRVGLIPRLCRVTCPVLLLEGAQSPAVIPRIQAALSRDIPQAARVTIPGAGHMLPITHAVQVAAAIAAHHSF